jgi:hypothetical protein
MPQESLTNLLYWATAKDVMFSSSHKSVIWHSTLKLSSIIVLLIPFVIGLVQVAPLADKNASTYACLCRNHTGTS